MFQVLLNSITTIDRLREYHQKSIQTLRYLGVGLKDRRTYIVI